MAKFSTEMKERRRNSGLTIRGVERATRGIVTNPMVSCYERGLHLRFISFRAVHALSKALLKNGEEWSLYDIAARLEEEGEWNARKER